MDTSSRPDAGAPAGHLAVRIEGLHKTFRKRPVLHNISFEMPTGLAVAIVGVNGAGKTTLLRTLLGFVRGDRGVVELFGRPASDPRARTQVAFLPEKLALGPDLSGWQSLCLLLGLRSVRPDRGASETLLQSLGFPVAQLDTPAREYSKGMAQKIGLVAAMLGEARLAILDEPMSGLDPIARRAMQRALQAWRERGGALLFTAHGFEGLEELADRLAVMHDGRLVFYGTPAELLAQHRPIGASSQNALEQAFIACVESTLEVA